MRAKAGYSIKIVLVNHPVTGDDTPAVRLGSNYTARGLAQVNDLERRKAIIEAFRAGNADPQPGWFLRSHNQ